MKKVTAIRRRLVATSIVMSSVVAAISVSVATAADSTPAPAATAMKAPSLPLTATFGKGTPGDNGGPYAVTLTNTSDKALTVKAVIVWSVNSHNRPKMADLPPHQIAAGGTWVINDLAAEDQVTLTAAGFEPLELKTPPGK